MEQVGDALDAKTRQWTCFSSLTGLTAIVSSNCSEREPILNTNLSWSEYLNPCALLLLYFYFAFETNRTLFHPVKSLKEKVLEETVRFRSGSVEFRGRSVGRTSGNDQRWAEKSLGLVSLAESLVSSSTEKCPSKSRSTGLIINAFSPLRAFGIDAEMIFFLRFRSLRRSRRAFGRLFRV